MGRSRRKRPAPVFTPRPISSQGIRFGVPRGPALDAGWLHISAFDGYQAHLRGGRLKLCADENIGPTLVADLNHQGLSVETAAQAALRHKDDNVIFAWARKRGRVLITFNHRQFWNDGLHKLIGCPGIIAISIPDTVANVSHILCLLEQLVRQLADRVPNDWWIGTKIRVQGDGFLVRRRWGGSTKTFKIKPDPSGHLYFKKQ